MLIAVNYHYVRPLFDAPYAGIHGITPVQFEEQLKLLSTTGTFVGAEQIRAALDDQPLPARSILITFDDGLREQYEQAWPVLRRLGIPALFFINTAPIVLSKVLPVHKIHLLRAYVPPQDVLAMLQRRALVREISLTLEMSEAEIAFQYPYDDPEAARLKYLLNFALAWEERDMLIEDCFEEAFAGQEAQTSRQLYMDVAQIRELAGQGCIGNHSHEHLPLGLLSAEDIAEQFDVSLRHLETWSGVRPYAMSYPYGSQPASSLQASEIAASRGLEFGFTMERAGTDDLKQRPLHLARFDCNDAPGGKASQWAPQEFFESVPVASWYRS